MAEQDDNTDKTHEPTQKKLDDARKKGEIARSTDVNVAVSYLGAWLFMVSVGGSYILDFGTVLQGVIESAFKISGELQFKAGTGLVGPLLYEAGLPFAVFAIFPAGLVVLALLAQRALIFTPSKLKPKASRISPIQNAKNKFGRGGLFEFAKSFVKLAVYSAVLTIFLKSNLDTIIGSSASGDRSALLVMFNLLISFLGVVVLIAAVIAVIDFGWQAQEHQRKNRMSHKEMTDEAKESEGDPHMKQARRSKAQEVAMKQMMVDVPTADVIIVNPTHFAVALKWDGTSAEAPRCVAKGVDEIALRMREIATEAGVPIHSDPPTARALHAVVDIGQEIQPEHYAAVALAIRFAETLKSKKRRS